MVIGHVVTTELSRAQLWKRITVLGTPHNFVDASLRHVVLSTCHASPRGFSTFFDFTIWLHASRITEGTRAPFSKRAE